MDKIKDYLTSPWTWIAFCIFIFWLWVTYATLNDRIENIEKVQAEIDMVDLTVKLNVIQRDVEWLKNERVASKK